MTGGGGAGATAVFLDRDGTINVRPGDGYVQRREDLRLLPGAAAAIGRLNAAGIWVAIVTNQRGVSRGLMTAADLDDVHARLAELLAAEGARVDAIYSCPHGRDDGCDCRKPAPGMILRAAREHPEAVDLDRAVLVGDAESDIVAAHEAGLPLAVLLTPGPAGAHGADATAPDLGAAVELVLGWRPPGPGERS